MKKIILALALIGLLGGVVEANAGTGKNVKFVTKTAKKHKKGKKGKIKVKKQKGMAGSINKSRKWTSRSGHTGKRSVHGGKYMSQKARTQI